MAGATKIDLSQVLGALQAPERRDIAKAFAVEEHLMGHVFGRMGLAEKREKDSLWVVLEGEVGVSTTPKTSNQVAVDRRLAPGEMFGIISFLRGGPRTATMRALTPVKVAALSQESYRKFIQPAPILKSGLLLVLAAQLAHDVRLCNDRLIKAVQRSTGGG